MNGEMVKGRYTVAKQLHDLMKDLSGHGDILFSVDNVQHQIVPEEVRFL